MDANEISILFVCTGNSCRSAIAEALMKQLAPHIRVRSAGTRPASRVSSMSLQALNELAPLLDGFKPTDIRECDPDQFTYVISLSEEAARYCATLVSPERHRIWLIDDPYEVVGTEMARLQAYKTTRQLIEHYIAKEILT